MVGVRLHTEDLFQEFGILRNYWIQQAIRWEEKLKKISQMEDRISRKVPAQLKQSENMEDNKNGFRQHFGSAKPYCKWKGRESRYISDSNTFLQAACVRVSCSLLATRITKNLGYTNLSRIPCHTKLIHNRSCSSSVNTKPKQNRRENLIHKVLQSL